MEHPLPSETPLRITPIRYEQLHLDKEGKKAMAAAQVKLLYLFESNS